MCVKKFYSLAIIFIVIASIFTGIVIGFQIGFNYAQDIYIAECKDAINTTSEYYKMQIDYYSLEIDWKNFEILTLQEQLNDANYTISILQNNTFINE